MGQMATSPERAVAGGTDDVDLTVRLPTLGLIRAGGRVNYAA